MEELTLSGGNNLDHFGPADLAPELPPDAQTQQNFY